VFVNGPDSAAQSPPLTSQTTSIYRLLDAAPAAIAVVHGPDHVFELVNPRYELLAGRPAEELLGKPVKEALPEVEAQGFLDLLNGVYTTGEPFIGKEVELTLLDTHHSLNRIVYVDFIYQPIVDDAERVSGIFIQANDVTDKVLARREVETLAKDLREQRDNLQQVIDVLPMGIAIGDTTGAITVSNAEARRIWGQPPVPGGVDEYVDYGLWSIDGKPLDPTEIAYARSLLNGEVIHGEQMLVGNKAEGTRIPLLQNSAPLRGEDGEITGAVIAFTDITRLKALEQQKDEFLGLVSHELRTPLTTILGNASVLARHGNRLTPEDIASARQDIQTDALRLQQIVENMLALSRVESRPNGELEPVLIERLIGSAVEEHRRHFPDRTVLYRRESAGSVVEALPSYVLQVVGNLLSNAEKYGARGEPIEVAVSKEDGMAVTRVLDRGPGISRDEAALIFESFYRNRESGKKAAGLGLGLTVSKRLIEAQHGRIWCAPRDGGGSEFGFSLPLSPD
jgi:PAS domain S-box-containing protein